MAKLKKSVVNDFLKSQDEIKEFLNDRGIKQKHVYDSIGMSRGTWTRRLKNQEFNGKEMLDILDVIKK